MAFAISALTKLLPHAQSPYSTHKHPSLESVRGLVGIARQLHEKGIDAVPKVVGPFLTLRVPNHQVVQVQRQFTALA